jgi:hypothetical protein
MDELLDAPGAGRPNGTADKGELGGSSPPRLSSSGGITHWELVHVLVHTSLNNCVRSPAFRVHAYVGVVLDHAAADVACDSH